MNQLHDAFEQMRQMAAQMGRSIPESLHITLPDNTSVGVRPFGDESPLSVGFVAVALLTTGIALKVIEAFASLISSTLFETGFIYLIGRLVAAGLDKFASTLSFKVKLAVVNALMLVAGLSIGIPTMSVVAAMLIFNIDSAYRNKLDGWRGNAVQQAREMLDKI